MVKHVNITIILQDHTHHIRIYFPIQTLKMAANTEHANTWKCIMHLKNAFSLSHVQYCTHTHTHTHMHAHDTCITCTLLTIAPLKKAVTMVLNRSCPAESQICSFIFVPSTSTVRILKSTPAKIHNSYYSCRQKITSLLYFSCYTVSQKRQ